MNCSGVTMEKNEKISKYLKSNFDICLHTRKRGKNYQNNSLKKGIALISEIDDRQMSPS